MIKWLFEIDTLRLSTIDTTHSAVTYSGVIIPDSFSGIQMRWNISGNGLIAPNDVSFDVSNVYSDYATSEFEGEFCTIKLIIDDVLTRSWKVKIKRAISYYGKITCTCVDFLQDHLVGDYPNTPAPKELWPSDDADEENTDDYCVPVVLGTAYIPVRSVNTGTERWYILGEDIDPDTYEVFEVMSPHAWPNSSTWSTPTYGMTGATSEGYQLLQPIIADSTGDGSADAAGLWRSGDTFYDMLCRFERDDTSALTNPAEWVEYVLEDFGVASADIDSVSFAAADANYDTLTLGFDGGGWWRKEPRERVLSNLLAQTDSFLKCTDKVELHQFDKTSQETITNVMLLSFAPSGVTKSTNDSGRVHWPESALKPSDVLNGKAIVPTHSGGTENTPSSEILECRFLADSIAAQKAGILYFQKKFEQSQRINFSVTLSSLNNKDTLSPGQVVTLDNSLYGGTNSVIITDMTINLDLRVDITGVVLNYLEDWGDLTTTTKDVVTDTSEGYQLATTDYDGTLDTDADWDTLLNIPDRFGETATTGINVTDSYLGYYDGSDFQSYIQNNGNFQFRGNDNNYINWNGTTLNVVGSITVKNASDVRTALNVDDGADVTQTKIDAGVVTTGTVQVVQGGTVAAGITGATSGDTAVRFWAGSTYANRTTAPFRVTQAGDLYANDATIIGDYKTHEDVGVLDGGVYTQEGMWLDSSTNEMYFYGDRGDTTIEKLVRIGTSSQGLISVGNGNYDDTFSLYAESKDNTAVYAASRGGSGVIGIAIGTNGTGFSNSGVTAYSTEGSSPGLYAYGSSSYGAHAIYANGSGYFTGALTALSYADNTPFYAGDALTEIKNIKGKNGEIDHSTLPVFAQTTTISHKVVQKKDAKPIPDGISKLERIQIEMENEEVVNEPVPGRDLGAMISILTVGIQQLIERVEALEVTNETRA